MTTSLGAIKENAEYSVKVYDKQTTAVRIKSVGILHGSCMNCVSAKMLRKLRPLLDGNFCVRLRTKLKCFSKLWSFLDGNFCVRLGLIDMNSAFFCQ